MRNQEEIRRFFDDVSPVPPGIVHVSVSDRLPRDDQPYYTSQQVSGLVGVARWDGRGEPLGTVGRRSPRCRSLLR
ncbi:hypothetical protein LP52_13805 [Streptomonospora alba]|uniref:Uncharacterized protein n=1 Tax=Streptomonospora alba TaxID=183763 RepID=A0A0C2FG84_9ACTN|nr:hypothetical protein [Streptomonospora alba]KIH98254.1 hypothetical protein LP52_13805 [Streptomonospora alba]